MTRVSDIRDRLEARVPSGLKMDFDNVGLLVGYPGREVKRALVALDITDAVIAEAQALGAELIVSHHPLFFSLKTVTDDDPTGRKVLRLASSGVSAICLHTNLDAVRGGVNDALVAALGAKAAGILNTDDNISRIGEYPGDMSLGAFMAAVKTALSANGLRYHDAGRPVRRVAVCGGSGGGDIRLAAEAGCDTFVTADVRHHQFLEAADRGINLVDADHFSTENVVVPVLADMLSLAFPELETVQSAVSRPAAEFYV